MSYFTQVRFSYRTENKIISTITFQVSETHIFVFNYSVKYTDVLVYFMPLLCQFSNIYFSCQAAVKSDVYLSWAKFSSIYVSCLAALTNLDQCLPVLGLI